MLKILLLTLFCLTHNISAAAAEDPAAAKAVVEKLHATLLDTMREGAKLGFQGRVSKLAPTLRELFDFATISRLVTGRYWAKLEAPKRTEFIEVFSRLSTATYADNFKSLDGEHFETRAAEDKKNSLFVKTVLIGADGKEVPLNYLLAKSDTGWRIINVVAEGVSDLSLKRAEYTAVIGSSGIDALIAKLKVKVASYGP